MRYKETSDVREVNHLILNGWELKSASEKDGKVIYFLIKDFEKLNKE